ncbi:MAG: hypothetical protein QOH33_177 [Paraburkholderia sp.]|nr:hypothetical protein [Paraburkholderia sp.]
MRRAPGRDGRRIQPGRARSLSIRGWRPGLPGVWNASRVPSVRRHRSCPPMCRSGNRCRERATSMPRRYRSLMVGTKEVWTKEVWTKEGSCSACFRASIWARARAAVGHAPWTPRLGRPARMAGAALASTGAPRVAHANTTCRHRMQAPHAGTKRGHKIAQPSRCRSLTESDEGTYTRRQFGARVRVQRAQLNGKQGLAVRFVRGKPTCAAPATVSERIAKSNAEPASMYARNAAHAGNHCARNNTTRAGR